MLELVFFKFDEIIDAFHVIQAAQASDYKLNWCGTALVYHILSIY